MTFLVAIGGHVGTGKTTLAYLLKYNVQEFSNALVVEDDQIRRELFGLGLKHTLQEENYSKDNSERVSKEIDRRTLDSLSLGPSVINSSGFFTEHSRLAAQNIAEKAHAKFVGLWLVAPISIMRTRIANRIKERQLCSVLRLEDGHASDADENVIDKFGDLGVPSSSNWKIIDTNTTKEKILLRSIELIGL